jgi:hypothetical protein
LAGTGLAAGFAVADLAGTAFCGDFGMAAI